MNSQMIDIETLKLRSFLSYGNYDTIIPLGKLGQCLISGEVLSDEPDPEDDGSEQFQRSNGAGKSTLVNAIPWCFFGRTMHATQPGDDVVNFHIKKDCLVSCELTNGDVVTRTRKCAGHNELLVEHGGEAIISTLSTTPAQQAALLRRYNLTWHTFTGSSFFAQLGRSWLDKTDPERKSHLEQLLRVDRYTAYAEVGKERVAEITTKQVSLLSAVRDKEALLEEMRNELREAQESDENFEAERKARIAGAVAEAKAQQAKMAQVIVPDAVELEKKWAAIAAAKAKVKVLEKTASDLEVDIRSHRREIQECQNRITVWKARAGKICRECRQEVPHEHVGSNTAPDEAKIVELNQKVAEATEKKTSTLARVTEANQKIAAATPTTTLRDIESLKNQRDSYKRLATAAAQRAKAISEEKNPHGTAIERLTQKITMLEQEVEQIRADLTGADTLLKHASYLHKAYQDRKKMKSFQIGKDLPYFNKRLHYYFDVFDVGVKLTVSDTLSVLSNKWKPAFLSGGERKRADVAMMLASFDTHEHTFGRQCNLIVLDEVDGRLDGHGIRALTNIIKNDLAHRVRTVLIISHRSQMVDAFPHHIRIQKHGGDDGFSMVQEVR